MKNKTCAKCGGPGPFNRDKNRKDGLNPWCKTCQNASTRAATDPENHRKYMSAYRKSDRGKASRLKYQYGIGPEEIQFLLAVQEGACAICRKPLIRKVIDHNHTTGKVRGLLCFSCNIGLGEFQDNPEILLAARDYLVRSN